MLIAKCEVCRREFCDYASNRRKQKHGVVFCSQECRAAWTGVHNSITRSGDGRKKTKGQKDALYYRRNADTIRQQVKAAYWKNRASVLAKIKTRDRSLKQEIIKAYGGKCVCCGERHLEFLTIDHTNGDGHAHRKQVGKGRGVYADLKRRGFPKRGYRLMCLNCNISLGFYGYCPHRPNDKRFVNKKPKGHAGRRRTVA